MSDLSTKAEQISAEKLEEITKAPTLQDFIRIGASVTEPAEGWGEGETACALSAGVIGAMATKWLPKI